MIDTLGCQAGWTDQQSDAQQAQTQSKFKGNGNVGLPTTRTMEDRVVRTSGRPSTRALPSPIVGRLLGAALHREIKFHRLRNAQGLGVDDHTSRTHDEPQCLCQRLQNGRNGAAMNGEGLTE